jgi:DNA-binding NarL/FixJ family response regulator
MNVSTFELYLCCMRITIIDDNIRLAKELKRELAEFNEIQWIDVKESGLRYVNEISLPSAHQLPDCILMDISMNEPDEGITTTRILHERFPNIKVVMFTISDDDDRVFEAFKAGAMGYLLKNEKPDFIFKAITDVVNGGALMSPGIALKTIRFLANPPVVTPKKPEQESTLTDRELEVLRLIAKGFTYQHIADQLFISVQTIKKHMSNIFKKLQVNNKIAAVNKTKDLL